LWQRDGLSVHRFYRIAADQLSPYHPVLAQNYSVKTWEPNRDGRPTRDVLPKAYDIWWIFDKLRVFANPNVGALMIFDGAILVHRSLVTPAWFRFPEMARDDLQIGDTWTAESHRGRGLAKQAIAAIHHHWAGRFARMWYLVEDENLASIRVIEAFDYQLVGTGKRTRPLYGPMFGQFVITG
jgi:GNAT superfamily N-acetyltransferase